MRIVAVITDPFEVNKILEYLNPTAIDCYKRMNMSSICLKHDSQMDTVEFR